MMNTGRVSNSLIQSLDSKREQLKWSINISLRNRDKWLHSLRVGSNLKGMSIKYLKDPLLTLMITNHPIYQERAPHMSR
jgi:hypothetical protein